ncbi:hypothetical protein ASG50_25190 [Rhizobium sp. Leaf386]|nr:hypothetical protein ASG50_25190 [Rhizobium sp. Leaf386]
MFPCTDERLYNFLTRAFFIPPEGNTIKFLGRVSRQSRWRRFFQVKGAITSRGNIAFPRSSDKRSPNKFCKAFIISLGITRSQPSQLPRNAVISLKKKPE